MAAYATSTERLYVVGVAQQPGPFTPVMVDQYAGSQVQGWGTIGILDEYDFMSVTAMAYDSTRDAVLVAWTGVGDAPDIGGRGIVAFDPHTGLSLEPNLPFSFPYRQPGIIHSLAVDPSNGDVYYIDEIGFVNSEATHSFGLYRNGELITNHVGTTWTLRFADAKWAGLATPP